MSDEKKVDSICVYCASSTQIDKRYFQDAYELGRQMGQRRITLVNGAGSMGLMAASADGCLEAGGRAIGIIPTFMVEAGWCHQGMTQIIETPDIHMRQEKMAQMTDGAIVLPGGCGTLAELTELITWKQLGIYLKPIVLLNTNGYYDPLLRVLNQAVEQNFMRRQHADIWKVAQTPQEAIDLVLSTPLWNTEIRRFAKI